MSQCHHLALIYMASLLFELLPVSNRDPHANAALLSSPSPLCLVAAQTHPSSTLHLLILNPFQFSSNVHLLSAMCT